MSNVQIINSSQPIENPENSSLYTFDDSKPEVAPAPSLQNSSNLPSVPVEKTTDISMQMVDEQSLAPNSKNKEEFEKPLAKNPLITMYPFEEGLEHYTHKPIVSESLEANSPISENMEIISFKEDINTDEWLDLEKQTQKTSSELCEQLRIILEPTKAKSLKGDYRTGKRINMKKVISYIASSFRKDKIWLRRTRQTAREYQILIAIDDSYSMNQHGLGNIAKKGLAAIAQALNKLEVGELAVAAIRQGLTLLHDFSSVFTAEHGAYILNELQFMYGRNAGNDQSYPNFVKQCYEFLSKRGNQDLQLVIILSDGRMNKGKVRPCLRKSEGIFYLFIIVDNKNSSILDMKSTVIDKINGKSVAKVYNYLEDFPFEYYVVVQSSEILVDVLADILKQWFELLRN